MITPVILAFWLVFSYALLKDRGTISTSSLQSFSLCALKWPKDLRS